MAWDVYEVIKGDAERELVEVEIRNWQLEGVQSGTKELSEKRLE